MQQQRSSFLCKAMLRRTASEAQQKENIVSIQQRFLCDMFCQTVRKCQPKTPTDIIDIPLMMMMMMPSYVANYAC